MRPSRVAGRGGRRLFGEPSAHYLARMPTCPGAAGPGERRACAAATADRIAETLS